MDKYFFWIWISPKFGEIQIQKNICSVTELYPSVTESLLFSCSGQILDEACYVF